MGGNCGDLLQAQALMSDDDKHCYVRVEDSGVGIPQSKLSEIFERFSQADNARGAYYQGTG